MRLCHSRLLLSMSGWVLAVLLAAFLLFFSNWRLGSTAADLPANVAALGMEVYYEKGPFVILVNKDFPRVQSLALIQRGNPSLNVMVQDLGEVKNDRRRSVMLGLSPNFTLSVDYSYSADNTCTVQQVMLAKFDGKHREAFLDHGGGGSFDTHIVDDMVRKKGDSYVWYRGVWQKTLGGDHDPDQDTFHKRLVDGTRVLYDKQKGEWRPVLVQRSLTTDEAEKRTPQNNSPSNASGSPPSPASPSK